MKEQLQSLNSINVSFSDETILALSISCAIVLYGVALSVRPNIFKSLFLYPRSAMIGLIAQIVVFPALTFLLAVILNPWITPMVAMGMILVAACPHGITTCFMSYVSKGNTELSIGLSSVSTVLAPIFTPFNFAVWGGFYVNYVSRDARIALQNLQINQLEMLQTAFVLLGIPLVLGILTAKYFPRITEKMKRIFQNLSILFFIGTVVYIFSQNLSIFLKSSFVYIIIVVLIQSIIAMGIGYGLARFLKLKQKNRRTLTLETSVPNVMLALVLLFNNRIFPTELQNGGMQIIVAWWGVWGIISGLILSFYWSRKPIED
jgi:BASS family bile acid:Na+ symporter